MDVLKVIKDLEERLFAKYGNPLEKYKRTQDDIHMTYYVGRLMEELNHTYVMPKNIQGDHEDRAYYSEKAIHDAFLAGRLLERVEREKMRNQLREEVKEELISYLKYGEY